MPDGQNPKRNEADNHSFRHGREVFGGSPINVTSGVFDKPEEVLEASFLVGSVDTLFAESVLFELPVVLFSDGSEMIRGCYL